MKATIDLDEALYRRLKAEAGRRGRTVRDLVAEGIRAVLDAPPAAGVIVPGDTEEWFGTLGPYAAKVARHDLGAMRASVARGRGKPAA